MREEMPLVIDENQFDRLPFGAIQITGDGTIVQYNAFESRLSRLAVEQVVNRNFFSDVAPCTKVTDFYGRFEKARAAGFVNEEFEFVFPFKHGDREVTIHIISGPDNTYWILVADRTAHRHIDALLKGRDRSNDPSH